MDNTFYQMKQEYIYPILQRLYDQTIGQIFNINTFKKDAGLTLEEFIKQEEVERFQKTFGSTINSDGCYEVSDSDMIAFIQKAIQNLITKTMDRMVFAGKMDFGVGPDGEITYQKLDDKPENPQRKKS